MEAKQSSCIHLIVGLGNPGNRYEHTRHNLGFHAVETLAYRYQSVLRVESKFLGRYAKVEVQNKIVHLLLPITYVNASGQAVKKIANFFHLQPADILVVADDLALPFATMRLRLQGSSGGHNGLKDIEKSLQTQQYARLRLGIDSPTYETTEAYVLQKFSLQQQHKLPLLLQYAADAMDIWIQEENKTNAMNRINRIDFCSESM